MSQQKPTHRKFNPNRFRIDPLAFTNVQRAQAALYHTRFCDPCSKLGLNNQADARSYIGLLLRTRRNLKAGSFALHPYLCRHGNGWHVGRNLAVLQLDFARGKGWRRFADHKPPFQSTS
jgi:hypothetical protein